MNAQRNDGVGTALAYALITPARNEAAHLPRTIAGVLAQTQTPRRWIIVDDASTDGTGEIAAAAARAHPWIVAMQAPPRPDAGTRHFGGKAIAFEAARAQLRPIAAELEVIGNLDADIVVAPEHFAFLMSRFAADPALGVAGAPFVDGGCRYDYRYASQAHVSGACQMFRRACLEQVGGYRPIPGGGIDWVAVTTARMLGWRTRTFTEVACEHQRPIGTAETSALGARFRQGRKDHALGGLALWQLLRSIHQMRRPPVVLGGLALLAGYVNSALTGRAHAVPAELVAFHRSEQRARLRALVQGNRLGRLQARMERRLQALRSQRVHTDGPR